jgi:hypothetical protein
MTGSRVFSSIPSDALGTAAGKASLTFEVKDLAGSPLDHVCIILSAGSAPPVRLTTSAGKATVTLSWSRLLRRLFPFPPEPVPTPKVYDSLNFGGFVF